MIVCHEIKSGKAKCGTFSKFNLTFLDSLLDSSKLLCIISGVYDHENQSRHCLGQSCNSQFTLTKLDTCHFDRQTKCCCFELENEKNTRYWVK